jgi:hypothetical protein
MRAGGLFVVAVVASACTATLPFDELSDGIPHPIAQYSFEEGAGVAAQDSVGSNHAALMEDQGVLPTWTREGKRGSALEFAASDGWVEAATLSHEKLPRRATFAAWIRFPAFDANAGDILEITEDTDADEETPIWLSVDANGIYLTMHVGPDDNPGEERELVGPPIAAGAWTFVAATWDLDANQATLYVRPEGSPARPLVTGDFPPGFRVRSGLFQFEASGGRLDEVRVFDRVLGPHQLDSLE